ncbi:N-acetylglucosamine-6-phosphate deacetylase [Planctomycetota bacterium]
MARRLGVARVLFRNCRLITPWEDHPHGWLRIHGEHIAALGHFRPPDVQPEETVLDLGGLTLAPGFVDLHCHGAGGGRAINESIDTMADFKGRHGCTAFLPTAQSLAPEWLELIEARRTAPPPGALVLGAHVECVYVNRVCIGGLEPERARDHFDEDELGGLLGRFPETIGLMALSPEIRGGIELIRALVGHDVAAAVGHSCVTWEKFQDALAAGLTHAIHLFNATRYGYPAPERGLSRARLDEMVMLTDEITTEVICDGIHVHPIMLRLALKAKGIDRISLITDARWTAGLPEGRYTLDDGTEVYAKPDDAVRNVADSRIHGSNLTMNRAVRNACRLLGLSLREAVQMATINPARVVGAASRMGSLETGKEANLVVLDDRLRVRLTFVRGRPVHDPDGRCPPAGPHAVGKTS